MAKQPEAAPRRKEEEDEQDGAPKKGGTRKLLIASFLLCLCSLGAGVFLARMAYLDDASDYEPEYVEEDAEKPEGKDTDKSAKSGVMDPLAKDDHPAGEAMALNKDDKKADDKDDPEVDTGLLEFADFLTNITSVDAQGMERKAFLKVRLIVAYRTDPGAADTMKENQPFMRDLFNTYLRSLNETDVRGMAGLLNIKSQLLKRARAASGSDLPEEILISDLIVQ
ncbi:MAG: flagellar basal body protein FliL [Shimia sp.]|nr:flagellar basal body protein FliL [Shimia sp.]